jgi:hypothetical protein
MVGNPHSALRRRRRRDGWFPVVRADGFAVVRKEDDTPKGARSTSRPAAYAIEALARVAPVLLSSGVLVGEPPAETSPASRRTSAALSAGRIRA